MSAPCPYCYCPDLNPSHIHIPRSLFLSAIDLVSWSQCHRNQNKHNSYASLKGAKPHCVQFCSFFFSLPYRPFCPLAPDSPPTASSSPFFPSYSSCRWLLCWASCHCQVLGGCWRFFSRGPPKIVAVCDQLFSSSFAWLQGTVNPSLICAHAKS